MLQQLSQEEKRSQMNWEKENFEHVSKHLVNYLHKSGVWGGNQGSEYSPIQWSIQTVLAVSSHYTDISEEKYERPTLEGWGPTHYCLPCLIARNWFKDWNMKWIMFHNFISLNRSHIASFISRDFLKYLKKKIMVMWDRRYRLVWATNVSYKLVYLIFPKKSLPSVIFLAVFQFHLPFQILTDVTACSRMQETVQDRN